MGVYNGVDFNDIRVKKLTDKLILYRGRRCNSVKRMKNSEKTNKPQNKTKKPNYAISLLPNLTSARLPALMRKVYLSGDTYHSGEYCSE